jgi:hypothetical protein
LAERRDFDKGSFSKQVLDILKYSAKQRFVSLDRGTYKKYRCLFDMETTGKWLDTIWE